ncbi:MAG: hypothetical protein C0617_03355 [Desulfuromonas sp.]|uniref:lipopolysaccharide biosynthesis protein n=1 Tax=Desulfuromonas sp. TaxID=892 RepID=UPI000CAD82A4|nr:oligosaccharide flippase family protein [Desulfuromonas sp.]PLX85730.1 MAG: hypothetical protein C0617_03355 [Desulfuromonas sp.]
MTDKKYLVTRELFWVVVGQVLIFTGGFASIKTLTNIMGPVGYGKLALGMTIAGFFNMFVYGPIGNVVIRYFSICKEREELNLYFFVLKKTHRMLFLIVLCFTALVSLLVYFLIGREWALLFLVSSLFGVVRGVELSFSSLQNATRQRKLVALHQGAEVWLRFLLAIGLLFLLGNTGYFALTGYLVGMTLITLSQRFFALKDTTILKQWYAKPPNELSERKMFNELVKYALPFTYFAVFNVIGLYSDRWILQGFLGASEVGVYSALYSLANAPILVLMAMLNQMMVPIIFEKTGSMVGDNKKEIGSKLLLCTVGVYIFFATIFILILFLFSEPLVTFLTNVQFSTYHQILWIVSLGLALFNLGQLFCLRGLCSKRPIVYFYPKLWHAISFFGFSFFGAMFYGLTGVSWGLCLSSIVYLVSVLLVNKNIGFKVAV